MKPGRIFVCGSRENDGFAKIMPVFEKGATLVSFPGNRPGRFLGLRPDGVPAIKRAQKEPYPSVGGYGSLFG